MTKESIWTKNFMMVLLGQIVSLFGNAILRFALPLYILEISGSATLFGTVLALSAIPMIIIGPLGGVLADRINKKRIMVTLDFITATLIIIYMLTMNFFSVIPATVVVMMVLFSIQSVMTPAVDGSIPLLISGEQLVRANSLVFLVNALSGMLGPAIGGILFAAFGIRTILLVSVIAFVLAAIMETFIRIPNVKQEKSGTMFSIIHRDLSMGMRFLLKENPLLSKIAFVAFFLQMSLAAFIAIGIPVLITQNLEMGEGMVGIAQALMGAGGIAGGIIAGVLGSKLRVEKTHLLLLVSSLLFSPLALSFLLNLSNTVVYLVLAITVFVVMSVTTLVSIQIFSFMQRETPEHLLGKVMSLFMMLALLGMPFGQFLFGVLFEQLAHMPWLVIGIAIVASAVNALNAGRYLKDLKQ